MLISVVIPTCNRNDLLIKCLDLLAPSVQTITEQYEVIVTDDSKTNGAKSLVAENYSWVTWIEGPKKGPASNRNNGAKNAVGKWIVFIDDDCLPDVEILESYQTAIMNYPSDMAFEGAVFPDSWEKMAHDMSECPVNIEGNCFWSANICVNRYFFLEIGGFDETYLIAAQEDQQLKIDIEIKIQKKIPFIRDCRVIHPVRYTTILGQILKMKLASKNYSLFAFKNPIASNSGSLTDFTISQYKFHIKTLFNVLRSGKFKSSVVSLVWIVYGVPLNILNLSRLGKKQHSLS